MSLAMSACTWRWVASAFVTEARASGAIDLLATSDSRAATGSTDAVAPRFVDVGAENDFVSALV